MALKTPLVLTSGQIERLQSGDRLEGVWIHQGAWSGATAYVVGDVVESDGSSYVCILAHTNHVPPNGTYWNVIASKGDTGATGATGGNGTDGDDPGFLYSYSTNTANTDPGGGFLKFDNATLGSATVLRISEEDAFASNIAAWIAGFDDSTSTVKGIVHIANNSNQTVFALFRVTGTLTDNGTWDSMSVTPLVVNGSFANNDIVRVTFYRTGDKGDTGTTGAAGAAGSVIQVFSTPGTFAYTKPANASYIQMMAFGGGGGGGSGAREPTGTQTGGGGGGGAGAFISVTYSALYFENNAVVVVGAGGTPGALQSVNASFGNPGGAGGTTSITGTLNGGASLSMAGGGGGAAGSTGFGAGGAGGIGGFTTAAGGNGSGAAISVAGGNATREGMIIGPAGGGGGGGLSTANGSLAGAAGGSSFTTGGGAGSNTPTGGGVGSASINLNWGGSGGGGGGGGTLAGGTRTGGDGGFPGGGAGGGGGSRNGTNSGAGGTGGGGFLVLITYCT